ncbi:MAG TPA: hypothetical protein PK954_09900, partial [Anaerolineales bacterium]|nr:hypothetical protein [Anaerolineales bacterium]
MAPNPPTNPSPARPIGCLLILLVLALICGSLFWPNPVTLDDIEIPAAKSFTCEPLSSSSSAGPALTLAPSGLWYQDAVILTGQPADVQRVAAQALGVEQPF